MANVRLLDITKQYENNSVLKGIDLDIADGEFVVLVGPSGCGKSTLLRIIAGLEDVSGGTVEIGGQVCNDIEPSRRGIAMVFQSYALYPHMTVAENMGFALKLARLPREDIAERVARAADRTPARPPPESPLRRPAPAGGDRAGDRAQAAGVPVRRAAV